MNSQDAKDYRGPKLDIDREARAAYLTLDPSSLSERTKTVHHGEEFVILADYDDKGNILGLEILW